MQVERASPCQPSPPFSKMGKSAKVCRIDACNTMSCQHGPVSISACATGPLTSAWLLTGWIWKCVQAIQDTIPKLISPIISNSVTEAPPYFGEAYMNAGSNVLYILDSMLGVWPRSSISPHQLHDVSPSHFVFPHSSDLIRICSKSVLSQFSGINV